MIFAFVSETTKSAREAARQQRRRNHSQGNKKEDQQHQPLPQMKTVNIIFHVF